MSSGNVYSMAIEGDVNIAGMYRESPADLPDGAVRTWHNHIYVPDADESVKRIEANGGKVLWGPNGADGWGVKAVVTTPENAVFGLWQSQMGKGADLFAQTGAVCWVEYHTHDIEVATGFYSETFGVKFDTYSMPVDGGSGSSIELNTVNIGGEMMPCAFIEMPDDTTPAHWATYFMVNDVTAAVEKAESLGAHRLGGAIRYRPAL